ncbi:MAG: hypothetical protein V3W35_03340 [Gemmatimonadota bacterium]
MADDDGRERLRFHLLRLSSCTTAQVERRAREVLRGWRKLRAERKALERDKRLWFESTPRRVDPERPFCFELDRMKRKWREADRSADRSGFPAHRTVGSSRARQDWLALLSVVLCDDEVVRVRHRCHDEPALLMRESRFRELEKAAGVSTDTRY